MIQRDESEEPTGSEADRRFGDRPQELDDCRLGGNRRHDDLERSDALFWAALDDRPAYGNLPRSNDRHLHSFPCAGS